MRFVVLGAGRQGAAAAYDLLKDPGTERLTLVDREASKVEQAARWLASDRVDTVALDCVNEDAVAGVLRGHNVAVSALPYFLNLGAARSAIAAGVHFVDMGGNIDVVLAELLLHKPAREAGICLVPDCGLAPGLVNILVADAATEIPDLSDVRIRVGGLPANPRPPWSYFLVFSIEGLLNELTGMSSVLRDWNRVEVEALTGLEQICFPDPVGECEAAFTSGGSSTLPWTFAGRIRNLDYKTVRYPGHFDKVIALKALGMLESEPVLVDGVSVVPKKFFAAMAEPRLSAPGEPDLVVLRVESIGRKDGRPVVLRHELMDFQDEESGLSAMMRTTAFSVSITAQMIATGMIDRLGAFPPEKVVPPDGFLSELERRGIFLRRTLAETVDFQSDPPLHGGPTGSP